ncbi:MAG: hypothetical protein HND44_24655 [Chloroflexi bacterium]|nr:hypothetical protein [Ardenticatenaceae bacterium]MBL1131611.1 hypothetical protein [Chloroflexota bacterium]NOG37726.1 hypothetical protein [Chloroflexota bacterium]
MDKFFSWETKRGEPVRVGDWVVTPQSQVLAVQLPFGGFVWHRPVSVVVEGYGEPEAASGRDPQIIPIPDVTRQALWAILGLSLLVNLLFSGRRRS